MEHYINSKHCRKCGDYNIRDKYIEAQGSPEPKPERIVRQCLRCGYKWTVKPMDAD